MYVCMYVPLAVLMHFNNVVVSTVLALNAIHVSEEGMIFWTCSHMQSLCMAMCPEYHIFIFRCYNFLPH